MNIVYFCIFAAFFTLGSNGNVIVPTSNLAENSCDLCDIFSLKELHGAFKNLKSIVDLVVDRIDKKLKLPNTFKLTGKISCQGVTCPISLPIDSIATITVQDTTMQDAPSVVLARTEINQITNFPFSYEIEYDKSKITNGEYSIRVEIRQHAKLVFTTDTHFSIVGEKFQPLDKVDFHVIKINDVVEETETETDTTPEMYMPGGLQELELADAQIKEIVTELHDQILEEIDFSLDIPVKLEPVNYRSQIVSGTNYFIKINAGTYGHFHIRVFMPLPHVGNEPKLVGIQWGPFKANDPIEYFDADSRFESNNENPQDFDEEDEDD